MYLLHKQTNQGQKREVLLQEKHITQETASIMILHEMQMTIPAQFSFPQQMQSQLLHGTI
jgi:hypothetical protein